MWPFQVATQLMKLLADLKVPFHKSHNILEYYVNVNT